MNRHIRQFYRSHQQDATAGHFHATRVLHDEKESDWPALHQQIPTLPKGWFELCGLTPQDRIEFVLAFWLSQMTYVPHTQGKIEVFFSRLDDIGIVAYQKTYEEPWQVRMVYSLADGSGFFQGAPPLGPSYETTTPVLGHVLPEDYRTFLKIHNGFAKYNDTGMIPIEDIAEEYEKVSHLLALHQPAVMMGKVPVEPGSLIPFYQSFHLPSYQCFCTEWYPAGEMGNVYFSGIDLSVSDYRDQNGWEENLVFPTFLDWLIFYLESIEEL